MGTKYPMPCKITTHKILELLASDFDGTPAGTHTNSWHSHVASIVLFGDMIWSTSYGFTGLTSGSLSVPVFFY